MENMITTEQDLATHEDRLPEELYIVHFKMVGLGPKALAEANYQGAKVCEKAKSVPGFFLLSPTGTGLRQSMHELVDRFCDAQERTLDNESKS